MSDKFGSLRESTARALLESPGTVAAKLRQDIAAGKAPAALAPLVEKIQSRAYTVTDEDVEKLKGAYSEDQLFEIVVSAAFGAAQSRLAAARKALEEA